MPRHRASTRPRHRAPSRHARPLATIALTGIALGGSVLSPLTAGAESPHGSQSDGDYSGDGYSDDGGGGWGDDRDDDGSSSGHRQQQARAVASKHARAVASQPTRTVATHPDRSLARPSSTRSNTHTVARTAHTRPMSSGEEQYRNGCRQGYIVEDCRQFDVPHLLQRGINPYL